MLAQEDIKIYHSPTIGLPATPGFQDDISYVVKMQPHSRKPSETASQFDTVSQGDRTVRRTRRTPFPEAEIMRWIGDNTSIPVPQGIQHGFDEGSQQYFLVHETPVGTPLDLIWDALDVSQQRFVISQLRQILQQLRQIHPAQIPNMRATDCFLDPRDGTIRGPYHTTNEFLEAISMRIESIGTLYEPSATRRVVSSLLALRQQESTSQDLVFTHGQLYADNILIDESGKVIAILDWSQAGYAPPFWEYVKSSLEEDDSNFFLEGVLDEILDPWPIHLAVMIHARNIIWN